MIILRKPLVSLAVLVLIAIVPVACVNNPLAKKDSPPVNAGLESRVLARWDALMNKDYEQAYALLSPAYRKLFSLKHYLSETGTTVKWVSVQVNDIRFTGKRAEVYLSLDYQLSLPMDEGDDFGTMQTNVTEVWLWNEGDWWHVIIDDGKLF